MLVLCHCRHPSYIDWYVLAHTTMSHQSRLQNCSRLCSDCYRQLRRRTCTILDSCCTRWHSASPSMQPRATHSPQTARQRYVSAPCSTQCALSVQTNRPALCTGRQKSLQTFIVFSRNSDHWVVKWIKFGFEIPWICVQMNWHAFSLANLLIGRLTYLRGILVAIKLNNELGAWFVVWHWLEAQSFSAGSVLESILSTEACKNGLPSISDLLMHSWVTILLRMNNL